MSRVDGRYTIAWPWKPNHPNLPDNFGLALGRMRSLAKRLAQDPALCKSYDDILQQQLQAGVIELAPASTNFLVHYLPHHAVVKSSSTTSKVRIVYDASARPQRAIPSLNDCLLRGPNLMPSLCGMLVRFRLGSIVLLADVEKAFLQLSIQEQDRDVTRFLWYRDVSNPHLVEGNLATYRFCRVPFGIICSPFLLEATVRYHLQSHNTPLATAANIYVDNVLLSAKSVDDAISMYHEAKTIFCDASMNLRAWISNEPSVVAHFQPSDVIQQNPVSVLGLSYDSAADTVRVPTPSCPKETSSTKRQVLSSLASCFDPLGMFSPVTIQGKFLLRRLWQIDLGWDDLLPPAFQVNASSVFGQLQDLSAHSIPRHIGFSSNNLQYQLHVFCDASQDCYAAATYLRVTDGTSVTAALLMSKTRLSPQGKKSQSSSERITIPHLELLGVVIGCRLSKFLCKELGLPSVAQYLWTDSRCVLHWLTTTKPMAVFVDNRLRELRQHQHLTFRFVPTDQNPADIPTRGATVSDLSSSSLWWSGPSWLCQPEDSWPRPQLEVTQDILDTTLLETRKLPSHSAALLSREGSCSNVLHRINGSSFSSLNRLLRVTSLCLKFIHQRVWTRLTGKSQTALANADPLLAKSMQAFDQSKITHTAHQRQFATSLWVRQVQQEHFADMYTEVSDGKKSTLMKQLGVRVDEHRTLRCYGSLSNAVGHGNGSAPALLPRKNWLTRLVIEAVHTRLLHAGTRHTLLRQHFWVPQGRAEVHLILKKCQTCKRYEGPAYGLPSFPALPAERITRSAPFEHVGLDYFGPMTISIGDTSKKVWVCLFTCFTICAIHMEWVEDLSASSFLQCFRRFVARRGVPSTLFSDNASQFKLANSVLKDAWVELPRHEDVQQYFASQGIAWRFALEVSPWQGGVYERMIGLAKRALRKTIGRQLLSLGQLITLLAEVEAVINTRPLTYIHSDLDSTGQDILSPAHFLIGSRHMAIPVCPLVFDSTAADDDYFPGPLDSAAQLTEQWKHQEHRLNQFWNTWQTEYLHILRDRATEHRQQYRKLDDIPVIDDVVVIKDENQPRGFWKLGRIVDVVVSSTDNAVRSAKVLTPSGRVLNRPLCHLYPVEIPIRMQDNTTVHNAEANGSSVATPQLNGSDTTGDNSECPDRSGKSSRPHRQAAQKARQNITEWLSMLVA